MQEIIEFVRSFGEIKHNLGSVGNCVISPDYTPVECLDRDPTVVFLSNASKDNILAQYSLSKGA